MNECQSKVLRQKAVCCQSKNGGFFLFLPKLGRRWILSFICFLPITKLAIAAENEAILQEDAQGLLQQQHFQSI